MITIDDIEAVYSWTPRQLGVELVEYMREVRDYKTIVESIRATEGTVLSREVIEALQEEEKAKSEYVFLIRYRMMGKTKSDMLQVLHQAIPG